MDTAGNQSLSIDDLIKENRILKRKLNLAETNLQRSKLVAETLDRVESVMNDSIQKELQYFQLVLENTSNILFLFDIDGRFAYSSKLFLDEVGIANFGLIGGSHYKDVLRPLVSEENLQKFSDSLDSAVAEKCSVTFEEEIDFNSKGTSRTYSIIITPMTDNDDESTGILALFNDITEINNALISANLANRSKSEFLANMSHEIRTPLNAITGMTAIAQSSDNKEQVEYCLTKINDSSTHLLGIINDILDMSKIEINKFELSITEFDFNKMLTRVVDLIRFKIDEKNITFNFYCDPAISYISSDEQRLSQVIMNLLSNAIKFTPDKGSVELRATTVETNGDDLTLRISVRDTGIGISEEQKARLFKPFSQADSSISRKFGGTGLGLLISKSIVNLLDGDIWFDSIEGKGTTFYFDFKTKTATEKAIQEIENKQEDITNIDFSDKTILLVDDIDINREIIETLLKPTGVKIQCAENGKKAVELFETTPDIFDLIFMDLQMPEMDGYQATRIIRSANTEKSKKVPIVAMTANVFKEDIELCLASGMNDHIGKPASIEAIIEKIKFWA